MSMQKELVEKRLATEVARLLERGKVLVHQHKEYCGMGLVHAEGRFVYGEVYDGELPAVSESEHGQEDGGMERKTFDSRAAFIKWLSEQSDESLSGKELNNPWLHDNQRLTIARLKSFTGSSVAGNGTRTA